MGQKKISRRSSSTYCNKTAGECKKNRVIISIKDVFFSGKDFFDELFNNN